MDNQTSYTSFIQVGRSFKQAWSLVRTRGRNGVRMSFFSRCTHTPCTSVLLGNNSLKNAWDWTSFVPGGHEQTVHAWVQRGGDTGDASSTWPTQIIKFSQSQTLAHTSLWTSPDFPLPSLLSRSTQSSRCTKFLRSGESKICAHRAAVNRDRSKKVF